MNSTSFTSIDLACASGPGVSDTRNLANLDSSSSSTTALLALNAATNNMSQAQSTAHRLSADGARGSNSDSDPDASPSVKLLTSMGVKSFLNKTLSVANIKHNSNNTNVNSDNNNQINLKAILTPASNDNADASSFTTITNPPSTAASDLNINIHPQHGSSHIHNHIRRSLSRPSQLITGNHFSLASHLHLKKHQRTMWSRASRLEKGLMLAVILLATLTIILFLSVISLMTKNERFKGELVQFKQRAQQSSTALLPQDQNAQHHKHTKPPLDNKSANTNSGSGGDGNSGNIVATDTLNGNKTRRPEELHCLTPDCVKVAASVIEAIDLTVDPCDDFYMYSCGDWIKSNPLPDGKSNWGTFSKLWQDNQSIMRSVLEGANFKQGSAEEKARIYYESCLDRNDTVESKGAKPMQDLIESAGGWGISGEFDVKSWDLQRSLQIYHNQYNRGGLFSWAVGADERESTKNIIQLDQGGLGLPSRDYYLNKTDKNAVIEAYLDYMIKIGELMGGTNVEESMKDLLELERKIAIITVPPDQRRDDERMYHKITLKELTEKSNFLNWTKYFDDAFDYHSRTTISFSSEINPRRGHASATNGSHINPMDSHSSISNKTSNDSVTNSVNTDQATNVRYETNSTNDKQHTSLIVRHKITDQENIVIYSPEYFEALAKLMAEYTATDKGKATLANYLAWSVMQSLISTLPKSFRDASKLLRKVLIGSEGIEVSWRYCVTDTNQNMGFALGSLFVRRVFQGNSKDRAEEMIFSIRDAFKDNLSILNWMDDETRFKAKEKADHINQMIGFPDFILNPETLDHRYEGLELDENNYFENNIKVNVLSLRENMDKITKPANKTEWEMTPPMVNAYYTPTKNQIVFPAGILQRPFYYLSMPNSLNYGAMGVVMGHELTHAFDDQGREYDKDGNLLQWWCNATLQNFEERVKCFVDQYSSYKIDDSNLNGKQTLGENIADNGGLKAAFKAYVKWSEKHPEPQLPGLNLTSRQLFFVGFAQVWCSISTPEALKLQVLNDPHAPAQFRVIGTLSNSQEFADEFNCPVGSKMNPEKKCVVW